MDERGTYELINAIIKQAADDYRMSLKIRDNRHAEKIKKDVFENYIIRAAYNEKLLNYIFDEIHREERTQ